ncbi:MAG: hypothetical protein KDE53_10085 [Caldilineaceae bacterium]|nr:hypothetical protein [Caldilineaceae bacterium]
MIPFARRLVLPLLAALVLTACAPKEDLSVAPEPLGNFKLGYNIVVVDKPEIGPLSRTATDAEWKASLEQAIDRRFSRFTGDTPYHIAIKLQAYALGQTGVPLVVKPKSVLVVTANVWATYGKLNPEPKNLTIWEGVSDKTLLGSGLTQTREEQMLKLSNNAAREIEKWMREHPEWFTGDFPAVPGTEPKEGAASGNGG